MKLITGIINGKIADQERLNEIFLSFEDSSDTIHALLRLRIGNGSGPAFIRELHVFGPEVPLGENPGNNPQHRGLGQKLMAEAEHICLTESEKRKISVISGVGAREYFRKFGYELNGSYMTKELIPQAQRY